MLPKNQRVPPQAIRDVLHRGKRVTGQGIIVTALSNNAALSRCVCLVSLKFDKRATVRNRARRLCQEAAAHELPSLPPGMDIVIQVQTVFESTVRCTQRFHEVFVKGGWQK